MGLPSCTRRSLYLQQCFPSQTMEPSRVARLLTFFPFLCRFEFVASSEASRGTFTSVSMGKRYVVPSEPELPLILHPLCLFTMFKGVVASSNVLRGTFTSVSTGKRFASRLVGFRLASFGPSHRCSLPCGPYWLWDEGAESRKRLFKSGDHVSWTGRLQTEGGSWMTCRSVKLSL